MIMKEKWRQRSVALCTSFMVVAVITQGIGYVTPEWGCGIDLKPETIADDSNCTSVSDNCTTGETCISGINCTSGLTCIEDINCTAGVHDCTNETGGFNCTGTEVGFDCVSAGLLYDCSDGCKPKLIDAATFGLATTTFVVCIFTLFADIFMVRRSLAEDGNFTWSMPLCAACIVFLISQSLSVGLFVILFTRYYIVGWSSVMFVISGFVVCVLAALLAVFAMAIGVVKLYRNCKN